MVVLTCRGQASPGSAIAAVLLRYALPLRILSAWGVKLMFIGNIKFDFRLN